MDTFAARACAFSLGLIIIILGILGFFTYFAPGNLLFGVFQVNTLHNAAHIASGVVGVIAAIPASRRYAAWYLIQMGILYGGVTLLSFALNGNFFNLLLINMNDNFLHASIAILALAMAAAILLTQPDSYIKYPEPARETR